MFKRALVMVGAAALTFVAFTGVATAQEQLVVNIPFDFVAGNKTLPAGEYYVRAAGSERSLVLVDREDPFASAFVHTIDIITNQTQSQSKMVFSRYGERYFLAQIWSQGNTRGSQLIKSNREKEIAKFAKLDDQGQVTLVANLR